MSAPRIPSPSDYACPKCGQEMQQQLPYCPRCGERLEAAPRFSGWYVVPLLLMLALMAIPAALLGSCFLSFGASDSSRDRNLTAIGLAGLVFAALCVWAIVALVRKRRGK